jgi:serine/threonine protein kinase
MKEFKEYEIASTMHQLARALMYIHSLGFAHRDVKPENIMIGNDGELKLIDFGLATKYNRVTLRDSPTKKTHRRTCKPQYLSPEMMVKNI